jgi:hypothetical protein
METPESGADVPSSTQARRESSRGAWDGRGVLRTRFRKKPAGFCNLADKARWGASYGIASTVRAEAATGKIGRWVGWEDGA